MLDKDFFDMLELETLDEDGDLEALFALVIDCDLEVLEVDDDLWSVVKLEEEIVLLLDEMDAFEETHLDRPDNDFEVVTVLGEADVCFEVLELNERVDDLVKEELEKPDDDFELVEPGKMADEGNCEQDFVLDRLFEVDERELDLPEVEGLLDVINPEEVILKVGAVVEDLALVFVMLVVAIEEEDLEMVDAMIIEEEVNELAEAETAVKEDIPINED
ncbi:hypothetical protein MMC29_004349 [Sticta canariensis]|nr:hypothetical protein [Sticta canariensis]